uniref:Large ribosomal subunit protein uL23c n=1 Tax=Ipomoea corymbosa TaxID=2607118 RepID=U3R6X2_IPOCR|nr:ribosomal protein L23 [Ipomoea corymbosa]
MDGIKYAVLTDKSIRLLGKNKYTLNIESRATKIGIKLSIELFFGVKVKAVNSHCLPPKSRRMGQTMRRVIITLQPGYSIQPLKKIKNFNQNT